MQRHWPSEYVRLENVRIKLVDVTKVYYQNVIYFYFLQIAILVFANHQAA